MIDRLVEAGRRAGLAAVWLAVAVAIALGGAGVAAALDHQPGTLARPELTWAGDAALAPELDAAIVELGEISALLDELGLQGRGALAALAARDFEILDRATAKGGILVAEIRSRSSALEDRLRGLPGVGQAAEFVLSAETRERHAAILAGLEATDGLPLAWARLTSGGIAAGRLSALLARHDERITAAIDVGRAGDFDLAVERIGEARSALAEAARLRNQLANNVDVGTLDEWIRRSGAYDDALEELYLASAESPDRITPRIRAADVAEQAARDRLPETTNGLTIVMADIAQGGLNQAVIAIEQARGELADALAGAAGER